VQVDPIKPKLKPPRTKRLRLKYDEVPSNFAFKFNLRRYNTGPGQAPGVVVMGICDGDELVGGTGHGLPRLDAFFKRVLVERWS